MHSLKYIGIIPLFILSFLFGKDGTRAGLESQTSRSEEYYTADDFKKVRKFDAHIHINTDENTFIKAAQDNNFRFLDIVDDRPFGLPMAEQQKIALQHISKYASQMAFATTFSVKDWSKKDWADKVIDDLKFSIAKGARAVKIWKNIGMDLRDENGKFVMVDHPKLAPIFNYLAKNQIPLIGHNGEPRDCWMPLDKMIFSKGYYGAHPEYHMYLHPEYPSYNDQIDARDNMLRKHPDLKFVGAHLGSLEWSLDELGKRFDKYPNLSVDLSRISNLQLHALNDWKKTREFFIKYQDRLVYGSDKAINATDDPIGFSNSIYNSWLRDWVFFATDEKINLQGFGELKGLRLPRTVIDKIYLKNAEKWLGGIPGKI